MGNVVIWAIVVFFTLMVVSKSFNSINKSGQKMKHHDRCEACKARLKVTNGRYATTCAHCGAHQSWGAVTS